MPTVTLESMNVPIVNNFKGYKNELFYNFPPKVSYQEYYLAPQSKPEGRRATFHAAMKLTIIIGQCFGLLPVLGACNNDTSKLRFTFFSGRCLYTILSILGQSGLVVFGFMKIIFASDESLSSNTFIVFFTSTCITTVVYLKMAVKWPHLCRQISKTEAADPNTDEWLTKRCNFTCLAILALAIVEHLLSVVSGIAIAIDCQPDRNLYDAFILQSYPFVWTFVPYTRLYGIIAQLFTIQCTFNWNYVDAFVICVSWYLTSRLEQVHIRMKAVRGKCVTSYFWRTMREDYSRIANLVRRVDDVINSLMFISFANNLFSICLQLLHTLEGGIKRTPACNRIPDDRPMKGYEQAVYFVYSFSFLVARSLAVSLTAARVHTASRAPAQELYDVPSSTYCVEVQRFLSQIHGDALALTGLQFFSLKRGLVLSIAGTIVTYELVLMQFAGVTPTVAPTAGPVMFLPSETTIPS